nr:hypothetical protein [Ectobacillus panaciterrae]
MHTRVFEKFNLSRFPPDNRPNGVSINSGISNTLSVPSATKKGLAPQQGAFITIQHVYSNLSTETLLNLP